MLYALLEVGLKILKVYFLPALVERAAHNEGAATPLKSPLRVGVTRLRMFAVTARDLNRGELKCNNCLWRVKTLYALASSREEAVKLVEEGEAGLCGSCMCDAVAEEGWEIG